MDLFARFENSNISVTGIESSSESSGYVEEVFQDITCGAPQSEDGAESSDQEEQNEELIDDYFNSSQPLPEFENIFNKNESKEENEYSTRSSQEKSMEISEETKVLKISSEEKNITTNEEIPVSQDESESIHLYRSDNLKKTCIRALGFELRSYINRKLAEYKRKYKIDLKKKYNFHREDIYNFLKKCIEEIKEEPVGREEFLKMYGILVFKYIRKKDALEYLVELDENEKIIVKEELNKFNRLGIKSNLKAMNICQNHQLTKLSKKLVESGGENGKAFWKQVFSTSKKRALNNKAKYRAAILEELSNF